MTRGSILKAIMLTGQNSFYPNAVAWQGDITLSFAGYALPTYYEFQTGLSFVGTDLDFHAAGILAAANQAEKAIVYRAAIGDANAIGFNEFTKSDIVIETENVGNIVIGKVNATAQFAGGVSLSIGSELSIWSELLNVRRPEMAGDIWIFSTNHNDMPTYVHELGHALGLNHTFNDLLPFDHEVSRDEYDSNCPSSEHLALMSA
jgi:hypothetical protein